MLRKSYYNIGIVFVVIPFILSVLLYNMTPLIITLPGVTDRFFLILLSKLAFIASSIIPAIYFYFTTEREGVSELYYLRKFQVLITMVCVYAVLMLSVFEKVTQFGSFMCVVFALYFFVNSYLLNLFDDSVYIGVRNKFTHSKREVWDRVNKYQSTRELIFSFILIVLSVFDPSFSIFIVLIILFRISSIFINYRYSKKLFLEPEQWGV